MSTSLLPRPDEQPDTLPEGLPLGDLEDLHIDIVSAISGEEPSESSLPTRKGFDEEPTRKKHAPKPPKPPSDEITDVTDLHDLFRNWQS